jgi:hypothetical protein
MKFDVIEGNGHVRALLRENIRPLCRKKTAVNLGNAVLGRFASQAAQEGDLVCYHCECVNCNVRKVDAENCVH